MIRIGRSPRSVSARPDPLSASRSREHEPDGPGAALRRWTRSPKSPPTRRPAIVPPSCRCRDPRVVAAARRGARGHGDDRSNRPAAARSRHVPARDGGGGVWRRRASALDAPGVTPERLRGFADAAKRFYDAAPWRHLDDGDLIGSSRRRQGRGCRSSGVMGSAGQEFGLSFFTPSGSTSPSSTAPTPETLLRRRRLGCLAQSRLGHAAERRARVGRAPAAPRLDFARIPLAARLQSGREPQRADAEQLAYFEGLLRALAATTEAEMDTGRWSRTVETVDGPADYTLALPDLLDAARAPRPLRRHPGPPIDGADDRRDITRARARCRSTTSTTSTRRCAEQFTGVKLDDLPSTASTPLEQAQDLIYDAMEAQRTAPTAVDSPRARAVARLRRRLRPAGRALAPIRDEQQSYYEQARRRRRARPRSGRPSPVRIASFWGDVSTRPYMRARFGLADVLVARGDTERGHRSLPGAAAAQSRRQPGCALSAGVGAARRQSPRRGGRPARPHTTRPAPCGATPATLARSKKNDRRLARTRLRAALRANRHVPEYLTGQRDLPALLPDEYTYGAAARKPYCAPRTSSAPGSQRPARLPG